MATRVRVPWRRLSAGERALIQAYTALGTVGAAVGLVVAIRIGGGALLLRPLAAYDLWLIASSAVGAMIALHLLRDRFGGPGLAGAVRALPAALAASLLAAVIGGTLALPLYGTMFGPFALGVTLFGAPLLGLAWAAAFVLAHVMLAAWHLERDSIFASAGDD